LELKVLTLALKALKEDETLDLSVALTLGEASTREGRTSFSPLTTKKEEEEVEVEGERGGVDSSLRSRAW